MAYARKQISNAPHCYYYYLLLWCFTFFIVCVLLPIIEKSPRSSLADCICAH